MGFRLLRNGFSKLEYFVGVYFLFIFWVESFESIRNYYFLRSSEGCWTGFDLGPLKPIDHKPRMNEHMLKVMDILWRLTMILGQAPIPNPPHPLSLNHNLFLFRVVATNSGGKQPGNWFVIEISWVMGSILSSWNSLVARSLNSTSVRCFDWACHFIAESEPALSGRSSKTRMKNFWRRNCYATFFFFDFVGERTLLVVLSVCWPSSLLVKVFDWFEKTNCNILSGFNYFGLCRLRDQSILEHFDRLAVFSGS